MRPADLPDVHAMIATAGPFTCRCGASIEHPGACDDCAAKWDAQQFASLMRPARESIPERFRWARFGDRLLAERVGVEAVRRVTGIPRPLPMGVVLSGRAGCGKTSLACALLRAIHDQARPDGAHAVVERARRAFFVSAVELEGQAAEDRQRREREGEADQLRRAMRASVLVLDNVEPGKADSAIGRVVFARFDAGLPTIVTTWMTEADASTHYGGGWARRVYGTTVTLAARPLAVAS